MSRDDSYVTGWTVRSKKLCTAELAIINVEGTTFCYSLHGDMPAFDPVRDAVMNSPVTQPQSLPSHDYGPLEIPSP